MGRLGEIGFSIARLYFSSSASLSKLSNFKKFPLIFSSKESNEEILLPAQAFPPPGEGTLEGQPKDAALSMTARYSFL
jgi:hypothetical protein